MEWPTVNQLWESTHQRKNQQQAKLKDIQTANINEAQDQQAQEIKETVPLNFIGLLQWKFTP